MGLRDKLLVSVLRSVHRPLLKQISWLPHDFHMAALHAECPSILADNSLKLGSLELRKLTIWQDAEALFASLLALRRLHLGISDDMGAEGAIALGLGLAKTIGNAALGSAVRV